MFILSNISSLPMLLLFAALLAHGDEVREPEGYWSGPINSPVPATLTGGKVIHARELADLLERSAPLVIDSSNAPQKPAGMAPDAPWLPLPQDAIPGSAWIPGAGLGGIATDVDELFRDYLSRATGRNFDHPVVIYCHEQCWLSWNAAKRAISYGYRNVYWLPEGIEGWRATGFKTTVVKPETPAKHTAR